MALAEPYPPWPIYTREQDVACFCGKVVGKAGDGVDQMMGDGNGSAFLPCACHKGQKVYFDVTRNEKKAAAWWQGAGEALKARYARILAFFLGDRRRKAPSPPPPKVTSLFDLPDDPEGFDLGKLIADAAIKKPMHVARKA